jgi:hypothetical protein
VISLSWRCVWPASTQVPRSRAPGAAAVIALAIEVARAADLDELGGPRR